MKPTVGIALAILSSIFWKVVSVSAMVLPNNISPAGATAVDAAMEATYDRLAQRAIDLYRAGKGSGRDGRCWIGIAGGPGAGKSTLAAAVADKIGKLQQTTTTSSSSSPTLEAIAVPMDGYHYTRKQLADVTKEIGGDGDGTKGMSRRGAPWTFDAKSLAEDLGAAKASGCASLPEYDRKLSDPVDDAVTIQESHQIVLVEGNYLILGSLWDEIDPTTQAPRPGSSLSKAYEDLLCPIPIGEEVGRWRDVLGLWDETWFVAPPSHAVETQRDRIIERSLETWNPSKTKAWGGTTDREAAIKRAEFNDVRNARLVECCREYADLVVDSI